jgi:hypothetical protein
MKRTRKILEVHISSISIGDTIICDSDGLERTVGKGNIKRGSFMGISIFGDSYRLGTVLVKKVLYEIV